MKWFANLKTRTKLAVAFGALVLLLGINILASLATIQKAESDFGMALALTNLDRILNEQRATILDMASSPDGTDLSRDARHVAQNHQAAVGLAAGLEDARLQDQAFRLRLEDFLRSRAELARVRQEEELPALLEGDRATALRLAQEQHDAYVRIRDLGDQLVAEASAEAYGTIRNSRRVSVLIGVIAVVLGLLLIVLLNSLLAAPLVRITNASERIARGDLSTAELAVDRGDEVGDLARAFETMSAALRKLAGMAGEIAAGNLTVQVTPRSGEDVLGKAFAEMVGNLRSIVSEIREGVNVLATSSSEMSAATGQLSSSAVETASAVNETTTTVGEVRQTAEVSHEKARSVAASAEEASQVAEEGTRVTEQLGEGIATIREQMSAIAQRMIALSERSQTIGNIVNSVEEIAVQSNLLAVNAAIEAARAGEQGKGFGVVADEVRNLAEQSRDATRRIRDILADVQQAISSAVMATEQGTKAVDVGVDHSKEARRAIHELSSRVEEAAQASSQIAASNHQQLVGVDQVGSAMKNIQQASGQNVASAKQLESASHTLMDLGRRLKVIVDRYKS